MKQIIFVAILCLLTSCEKLQNEKPFDFLMAGEELGIVWSDYFLANDSQAKAAHLSKVERLVDKVASRIGNTHRFVLNQRLLIEGTRAIDLQRAGDISGAESFAEKAYNAWVMLDPTSPKLQGKKTSAEKLTLVEEHVSTLNNFAMDLIRAKAGRGQHEPMSQP